jgi:hypothetical protein
MEKFRDREDKSEADKSNNDILWLLLIQRFHQVADFSQENGSGLHEAKNESSNGMIELPWAAQSVLHHVHAVPGLWQALPMEDKDSKEQAQVDSRIVLESQIERI